MSWGGQGAPVCAREGGDHQREMGGIDQLNRLINELSVLLERNKEMLDVVRDMHNSILALYCTLEFSCSNNFLEFTVILKFFSKLYED